MTYRIVVGGLCSFLVIMMCGVRGKGERAR